MHPSNQPDQPASAPRPASRFGASIPLLMVAVVALLAVAFLWHELELTRQAAREHDEALFKLAESDRNALRTELSEAQRQLRELAARDEAMAREMAALDARNDAGRGAFALAEARHLIELANESVHLAHDPQRAAEALRAADRRLAELGDGGFVPARAEIARQVAALTTAARGDAPGLAIALLELGDKIFRLPLRTRLPDAMPPTAPVDVVSPSIWDHFVDRIEHAFRGLVTVRRAPGGAEPLLAPEQEYFLRRNLELKLETARLAALGRDAAAFRASVASARDWLAVYFDPTAPEVREAVRDLDAMTHIDLAPPLPDLTKLLALLEPRGSR